jgi:hypothetical protein
MERRSVLASEDTGRAAELILTWSGCMCLRWMDCTPFLRIIVGVACRSSHGLFRTVKNLKWRIVYLRDNLLLNTVVRGRAKRWWLFVMEILQFKLKHVLQQTVRGIVSMELLVFNWDPFVTVVLLRSVLIDNTKGMAKDKSSCPRGKSWLFRLGFVLRDNLL